VKTVALALAPLAPASATARPASPGVARSRLSKGEYMFHRRNTLRLAAVIVAAAASLAAAGRAYEAMPTGAGPAKRPLVNSGVFASIRSARIRIGPMLPIGSPIRFATSR
jgi:hypothetical protein